MSNVSEKVRPYFESLPITLKDAILARDVRLNSLNDLMRCLQEIVDESES